MPKRSPVPTSRLCMFLGFLLMTLGVSLNSAGSYEDNSGVKSETASQQLRVQSDEIKDITEMSFAEPMAPPGRAPTDTLYLMGGPGQLSGKFQDVAGLPDRQGWLGVDMTQAEGVNWNISTFNAANLDTVNENHAWWCGTLLPPCSPEDAAEGYGDNWLEYLDWYGTVPNPAIEVTVRVAARMNIDSEPACDYLHLQYEGASSMVYITHWDGRLTGINIDEVFVVSPADYVGEQNDQVHLRWNYSSDGAWSDEDCLWPTDAGAAQLDQIDVFFDQGDGEVQIGTTETCEPGDPAQWLAAPPQGSGDFSKVWPLLDDLDPDHQNDTPQFCFIDDGEVVPGTGGYPCTTWCYGPGGYIVNPDGGLPGPWNYIESEIWSPVLERPEGDHTGALLSFDVYVHVTAGMDGPWIYHYWKVRSRNELRGPENWTEWRSRHFWYGGGPSYVREHHNIADLLLTDYSHVQLAFGVIDLYPTWGANDGTPAPYFDNVALKVYEQSGPDTHVVSPDGSGDYATIQMAITAAAHNDTIELADGIYTGPGNRDIEYLDKSLYVRSQSGDPTACIIDCQGSESENRRGFRFASSDAPEMVLEGVTIRNGYSTYSGGGISCRGASPSIRNCIFENNTTEGINNFGGGLYCQNASPAISGCVFRGNIGYRGGAIGIGWDSQPVISNCVFEGNFTPGNGSAVACWYYECNPTVVGCTFTANGGEGGFGIIECRFDATLLVENSIIAFNTAGSSVSCLDGGMVNISCSDVYGNPYGDWVGCIAGQQGVAGNISLDPLFCGYLNPDDPFTLLDTSPCSPEYNPVCGLKGARPVACSDQVAVDEQHGLPGAPALLQCFPNPFNPRTNIVYELAVPTVVTLSIFDVAGRTVQVLAKGEIQPAGTHTVTWIGMDSQGRAMPSGTYFYRLEAEEYTETRRMMLVR